MYVFVNPLPILLHINVNDKLSILDALPLMDTILQSTIEIYTIIDGICKNTIILPFIVGKKRYMYKNAHIYITKSFFETTEKNISIEDKMINLNTFKNNITKIFKKYTKFTPEIYKNLYKRELFFNAEEALKFGLIDEII